MIQVDCPEVGAQEGAGEHCGCCLGGGEGEGRCIGIKRDGSGGVLAFRRWIWWCFGSKKDGFGGVLAERKIDLVEFRQGYIKGCWCFSSKRSW